MSTPHSAPPLPRTHRPCPAWCDLGAGHPFESVTPDGEASRFHSRTIGQVQALGRGRKIAIEISCEETATTVPGHVTDSWGDDTFDLIGPSRWTPPVLEVAAEEASLGDSEAVRRLAEVLLGGATVMATLERSC